MNISSMLRSKKTYSTHVWHRLLTPIYHRNQPNVGSKRPREDLKTRGFRRYEAPEGQVLAGEGRI